MDLGRDASTATHPEVTFFVSFKHSVLLKMNVYFTGKAQGLKNISKLPLEAAFLTYPSHDESELLPRFLNDDGDDSFHHEFLFMKALAKA